jgi:hypothetical protein
MEKLELIEVLSKCSYVDIRYDGNNCYLKISLGEDKEDVKWFEKAQSAILYLNDIYNKNSVLIIDRKQLGSEYKLIFDIEDKDSNIITINGLGYYFTSIGQIRLRGSTLRTSITFYVGFDKKPLKGLLEFSSISYFEGQ